MANYIIRECTESDIQQVHDLQIAWRNEDNTYGFEPSSIEDLRINIGKYFIVLEIDKNIRGYVLGSIHTARDMNIFKNGEEYIEIDDIYIERAIRNNGFGELLIKEINKIAETNGITHSLLYSATKNIEGIIKFYKNCGYKSWYVQMYK